MAAFPRSFALILASGLLSALSSLSVESTCSSEKFSGRLYSHCEDLPYLSAHLHWTYDESNSSLSIAFVAPPAKPDGWVAWAINPTGAGMAGAQALIASKSNGSVVLRTFNISSYSELAPAKLSFDVWNLSAVHSAGNYTIFATVKVPAKAQSVNQVWQVGPGLNETNGWLLPHAFSSDNLKSTGVLKLTGEGSPSSAPSPTTSPLTSPSPSPTSGSPLPSPPSNNGGRSSEISEGLRMVACLLLAAALFLCDFS